MKPSDIKQLQAGDKIYWSDPEEFRSQKLTIKKIKVVSYDNIVIETQEGHTLQCPASQIKRV